MQACGKFSSAAPTGCGLRPTDIFLSQTGVWSKQSLHYESFSLLDSQLYGGAIATLTGAMLARNSDRRAVGVRRIDVGVVPAKVDFAAFLGTGKELKVRIGRDRR